MGKSITMNRLKILFTSLVFIIACKSNAEYPVIIMETNYGTMKIKLYEETPLHSDNFIKLVKKGYYDGVLFHRVIKDFMIQTGDPDSKGAAKGTRLGTGDPGYTIPAEFNPKYYHKKGALAAARQGDQVNPKRESSGSQFYIVQGKTFTEDELTTDAKKMQQYFAQFINEPENAAIKENVVQLQRARKFNELQQMLNLYKPTIESYYNVDLSKPYPEDRLKSYTTIGGAPHLDDQYTVFGEVIEGLEIIDKIAAQPVDQFSRPLEDIKVIKMYIEK